MWVQLPIGGWGNGTCASETRKNLHEMSAALAIPGEAVLSRLPNWARGLLGLPGLLCRRRLWLHLHFSFPGIWYTACPSPPHAARVLLRVTCPAGGWPGSMLRPREALFGSALVRVRLCC